ncbi:type VII secretion target [Symbioplanes lichenis]|uniref:type VII secretion target n=1 Tax=Symbioplanes lichenis TaxID=1629072 RepID=UPI002738A8B2|nr:type VII secretion target [Actinoplanes lichenis]
MSPAPDQGFEVTPEELQEKGDEFEELSEQFRVVQQAANAALLDAGQFSVLAAMTGTDAAYAALQQEFSLLADAGTHALADIGQSLKDAATGYQGDDQNVSRRFKEVN